ncbi:hypothetical protein [Entomohabitans teleogrylli]|uniref:hypothetical protein n=1 Tax=Entomohabitans teleogrylli TaxID=1384589 RepID=UPI000AAF1D0A|nr:hypothetical protein [Entomohabitans teleogrylli]
MGVELISVGSQAPWYTKVSPPVIRGLEGWFCFDTDIARAGFNRAPGKSDATLIGSPTVSDNHIRLKGLTNYLTTDIIESSDMTVLIISRAVSVPDGSPAVPGESTPMHFGTYSGTAAISGYTTSYGVSIYNQYPDRTLAAGTRDDGTGSNVTSATASHIEAINDWGLRVLRTGNNVSTDYINLTTNSKASTTNTNIRVPTTQTLRIGSGYVGFAGTVDVSQLIVYSVVLTDAEISQIAALMRTRAARLGISI